MKKAIRTLQMSILAVLMTTIMSNQVVMAQIDNLANLSPEYVKSGTRNAANDAADAAVYNPAGLISLEQGLYISVGNQSLFRNPSHEYDLGLGEGVKKFSQNGADLFLPSVYGVYRMNKMALYGGYYISGGGATANYTNGSINTDLISMLALMGAQGAYQSTKDQYLKATSNYSTLFGGVSVSALNNLSFAVSAKYISAKNETEASTTLFSSPFELPDAQLVLNTEETAKGVGFVFSLNYQLNEMITLATHYETNVALNFETNTITDDLGVSSDGYTEHRDLPAVFAFGTQIKLNDKLTVMADYNYYFQQNADWGKTTIGTDEYNWSELAGDASLIGLSVNYNLNDKVALSLGSVYTMFDYPEKDLYFTKAGAFETNIDDNVSINTGISYTLNKTFSFTAGVMQNIWKKDVMVKAINASPMEVDVKTNNSMTTVALGVNMHF